MTDLLAQVFLSERYRKRWKENIFQKAESGIYFVTILCIEIFDGDSCICVSFSEYTQKAAF